MAWQTGDNLSVGEDFLDEHFNGAAGDEEKIRVHNQQSSEARQKGEI